MIKPELNVERKGMHLKTKVWLGCFCLASDWWNFRSRERMIAVLVEEQICKNGVFIRIDVGGSFCMTSA